MFLRRFGPGTYRLSDGATDGKIPKVLAHNESWFISGKRFARVTEHQLVAPRLFLDGLIAARLEIIVAPPAPADGQPLDIWLKTVLQTQVEVRSSRKNKRSPKRTLVPLSDLGPHFRRAFVAATTPEPRRAGSTDQERAATLRLVQPLEPLLILLNRTREDVALTQAATLLRLGGADFRTLTLWVAGDPLRERDPEARLIRRAFVRLHAQASAVHRLAAAWDSAPPLVLPSDAALRGLGALADSLHDSASAPIAGDGPAAPMLSATRDAAEAADRLYRLLDAIDPDVARRQYRLSRRLTQADTDGRLTFVNIDSIIGRQGDFHMTDEKTDGAAGAKFNFDNKNSTIGQQGEFHGSATQNVGGAQLPQLATELQKLGDKLKETEDLPEAEETKAAIAEAQTAAAHGKHEGVLAALGRISGNALEKVLEVAGDIAAKVAVAYLNKVTGGV